MANSLISPGIETKIIDLNTYLTSVSGTIGFVPVITEKGKDNELVRITSYQDYIDQFGEPDMRIFGKYYGCGPYVAAQHLSVSSDLYVVRALPDDATYAHAFIYFSQVADYPYSYQFAKRYADQILDPNSIVLVDLYDVSRDGDVKGDKRQSAINAGVAFDSEMQNTNVADDVQYTSDTIYAKLTSYTELYDINVTDTVDKREDAIAAGKAYGSNYKVLGTDAAKEDAVYTSDAQYSQDGAVATHYAADDQQTYTRSAVMEATGSAADFDTGFLKNHNSWYTGKHTSISAFSVVPGMIYPNMSDITCYQHVFANQSGYVVDSQFVDAAFVRRCGYDTNGLLVLDDKTKIVYTNRTEFAKVDESGEPIAATRDLKVAMYTVDPEPWYVVDPTKIKDAIADYDAYDTYGFLTNDIDAVKYCGNFSYAKVGTDGKYVTETSVALRKPTTKKITVDGETYTYVMDRKDRSKTDTFVSRAKLAIAKFSAWDKNGYPALTPNDVYVTGIEEYATTSTAPKMNNTQKLDSLFFGNDTLTLAAIKAGETDAIYSKNKRLPSKCILGSVRAVGRGSYYNDYSIKVTSDANPQNFGTYKFQVFELQDGAEVLCESFNVSFDPTALDGDGESLYFADVINKFSERIVVEANTNAVDLFQDSIKEFYQNDPTIAEIAEDVTFSASKVIDGKTYTADVELVGNFPSVIPTFVSDETDDNYGKIINADLEQIIRDTKQVLVDTAETPAEKIAADSYDIGYKGRIIWEAYYAKAWAEKYTFDAAKAYNEALEMDDSEDEKTVAIGTAIDMMNTAEDMTSDAEEIYSWATAQNLMNMNDSDVVTAGEQPYYLQNGSLGSLINKKGVVDSAVGNQILAWAYTGLLKNPVIKKNVDESTGMIKYKQQYTDNVYDTDWIYFTLVYDPGYKPDVKDAARELVETYRRDCVLLSDCSDNADAEDCLKYVGAVKGAADCRIWNTYLAARYEPYSRIYDKYTGKDMWVSPIYHMAAMIPKNDKLYSIAHANAGFNRAVISSIKELRYSANKAQRDLLYQAQVNPIVHFPEGMTVWGNLTTQKKASPLSDLNSVRVVLYIKRALEQYCRNFIFEFNDSDTWNRINTNVSSFMSNCQSSNLIEGFNVEVGATDYELKTKTCHVNVTITVKKTLEKIELNLYVQ